jgi:hypothetical protein
MQNNTATSKTSYTFTNMSPTMSNTPPVTNETQTVAMSTSPTLKMTTPTLPMLAPLVESNRPAAYSYLTCQPNYYVSSSGLDTYASVTGTILSTNTTSTKTCCVKNTDNVNDQTKTLVQCCQTYFPKNGYTNTTFTGNDDSGAPVYKCF